MDPKNWQDQLIGLFCDLSDEYRRHLWVHAARLSPNQHPTFSDEEVLSVYIYGLWQHLSSLSAIHHYTQAHLAEWFPHLPSYGGFVQRLNRLQDLLPALGEGLLAQAASQQEACHTWVVDSMPILLAQLELPR